MGQEPADRSTRVVIESHLAHRDRGDLEGDLRENYSPDVLLMSAEGINHGHDGVRRLAAVLSSYDPSDGFIYHCVLTEGELAFLAWSAKGGEVEIHDGADSFVVRGGRIVAQTIHYATRQK